MLADPRQWAPELVPVLLALRELAGISHRRVREREDPDELVHLQRRVGLHAAAFPGDGSDNLVV
jgi:GAF domain-containing protein